MKPPNFSSLFYSFFGRRPSPPFFLKKTRSPAPPWSGWVKKKGLGGVELQSRVTGSHTPLYLPVCFVPHSPIVGRFCFSGRAVRTSGFHAGLYQISVALKQGIIYLLSKLKKFIECIQIAIVWILLFPLSNSILCNNNWRNEY